MSKKTTKKGCYYFKTLPAVINRIHLKSKRNTVGTLIMGF